MNATEIDLETLCAWSEAKQVPTRNGDRMLRKAPLTPDHPFWTLWRDPEAKSKLKAAGISCGPDYKDKSKWEACWWLPMSAEVIAEKNAAVEMSRATDADVAIPAPEGLDYLPYQRAGIAYMAARPANLLGDEMGLGKTIQAIGIINSDPKIQRVIVICPATLKINWYREHKKWLVRKMSVGIADGKVFPSTDIVIVNFEILKNFGRSLSNYWDLLVVDECHFLKNPKAQRTKIVFGYKPSKKSGEKGVPPLNARRKLLMTGSPIVNKPMELFPLLNFLDPVKWNNFFKYGIRYCAGYQGQWGWDFTGASHLDELQRELRATIMLRRLKKDVLVDLPAKQRMVVELDPNGCEGVIKAELEAFDEEALEAMEADVEVTKAGENEEEYKSAIARLRKGMQARFEEISELRHRTAVAKIPKVIEYIDEQIEALGSNKVLVFCHHRDVIAALQAHYPKSVAVVGGMSGEEKMAAVDAFQKTECVGPFIGGITAAGVGLTLTAASLVIFAELDWVPGNMAQCEDRAHRIGQKDCVLVRWLVLEGSLDAKQAKTLVKKVGIIDQALDKGSAMQELTASPVLKVTIGTWTEVAKDAEAHPFTQEQKEAILLGLQIVAGVCDGARARDGAGFNGCDSRIGKSLASRGYLSDKQCVLGLKLCNKYRVQIGSDIVDRAKGSATKTEKDDVPF